MCGETEHIVTCEAINGKKGVNCRKYGKKEGVTDQDRKKDKTNKQKQTDT